MDKIKLRVPATSANLGSGFDCAGIAFKLYNTFEFEKTDCGFTIEGCDKNYSGDDNLAYVAYKAVCDRINAKPNVKITFCDTDVPVSRGLGSSATLICAGAYAANMLNGGKLTENEIFQICTKIEGHPDNVAPALFGSLCASVLDGEKAVTVKFSVSEKLFFTALIPDFEVATKDARAALPTQVLRSDAVYNMSRVELLPYAFENGDTELLKVVLCDKIHEKYRKKLFRNVSDVEKICRENGAITFNISGAGSTCLCISKSKISDTVSEKLKKIANGWKAISLEVSKSGVEEVLQ